MVNFMTKNKASKNNKNNNLKTGKIVSLSFAAPKPTKAQSKAEFDKMLRQRRDAIKSGKAKTYPAAVVHAEARRISGMKPITTKITGALLDRRLKEMQSDPTKRVSLKTVMKHAMILAKTGKRVDKKPSRKSGCCCSSCK